MDSKAPTREAQLTILNRIIGNAPGKKAYPIKYVKNYFFSVTEGTRNTNKSVMPYVKKEFDKRCDNNVP